MSLIKPYYKEVNTMHVGCEEPHAYFIPFESRESALTGNRALSDYFQQLSGEWDFRFFKNPAEIEDKTLAALRKLKADKIPVPASWENLVGRGYDVPNYTNVVYPFPLDPPNVPAENNPCALYSRTFTVTEKQLKNKRAMLTFEGVSSCFYVWVNGKFLAYSEVSHCTSEIDATDALVAGENKIDVLVIKFSTASYLEDQDMFRCGGIFREVYLLFRDTKCIRDISVKCELSKSFKKATFTAEIDGDIKKGATFALLDENGNTMTEFNTTVGGANPRSAIGMIEPLHYVLVTVDGRGESAGLSMTDLSALMKDLGCTAAYNLDGGATAAMAVNGALYSTPSKTRSVFDIIYVAMED